MNKWISSRLDQVASWTVCDLQATILDIQASLLSGWTAAAAVPLYEGGLLELCVASVSIKTNFLFDNCVNLLEIYLCLFQMVACILIGGAVYSRFVIVVETVTVMRGLVVCGVLLLLVSIIGLIGAIRHHQVLLFFVSLYLS